MSARQPPTSQTVSSTKSGASLRSNGTRAATHMTSSTSIRPSWGEGSMKASELVSTVMNRTKCSNRCGNAAAGA
jgi:hypothetical protein